MTGPRPAAAGPSPVWLRAVRVLVAAEAVLLALAASVVTYALHALGGEPQDAVPVITVALVWAALVVALGLRLPERQAVLGVAVAQAAPVGYFIVLQSDTGARTYVPLGAAVVAVGTVVPALLGLRLLLARRRRGGG